MTAIFGLILEGVGRELDLSLRRMQEALRHRGANASTWTGEGVGVGVVGSSPSHKVRSDGSLVVAGDVRLDNRADLAASLGLRDPLLDDGELLAAAYKRWRRGAAARLTGDFAFACWDDADRTLFLARDHFAIRPLYFCSVPGRLFAFATEPKAILALEQVPRRVNEVAVVDGLLGNPGDVRQTYFKGVERLPAAHHLTVGLGKVGPPSRYWALDPDGPELDGTAVDFVEAFLERFKVAVGRRLCPSSELGAQLSGGLDSSSVACMARHLLPATETLRTYTAGFTAVPSCDERAFVEIILDRGGYLPTFVEGDIGGPLTWAGRLSSYIDGPVLAGNLTLNMLMCEAAKAAGVKVMLDGFDGDTTVSHGKERLAELARSGRLLELWRQGQGFAATFGLPFDRKNMAAYLRVHTVGDRLARSSTASSVVHIARRLATVVTPTPNKASASSASGGAQTEFVSAEIMKLIESQRGAAVETSGEADRRARVERRGHVQALTQGVMPQTLETLDAVSGAFGIQPRYPFWDKDLIELCVSLPSIAKLDRGWTRVVMRDAMAGILPPEIQWRRRKSNLGPNFHRGLLELDRERLDALFESRQTRLADFVNVAAVRRHYETLRADYDRAGPHGVDHAAASRLFRAASVGVWLEDTAP